MRNFVVSILCLGLILGCWFVFNHYSEDKISSFQAALEQEIQPSVESGNWKQAADDFAAVSKDWHGYKKKAAFFLDTRTLNDTDCTIARAKYYIKAKDLSNSSGELACLKEQLTSLHYNESPALGNIF